MLENRLRNLKQSMKKSVFKDLVFTEKHQDAVRRNTKQEAVFEVVLQLLVSEKTGMELVQLFRARNVTSFNEQEGLIYTILHQLEKEDLISSRWNQYKYYVLNQKGLKTIKKMEIKSHSNIPLLKRLLEGESS
jgi:DNA-binding PadR family transcriptional regulator